MTKKFRNLLEEMSSYRLEKIEKKAQAMLLQIAIQESTQPTPAEPKKE